MATLSDQIAEQEYISKIKDEINKQQDFCLSLQEELNTLTNKYQDEQKKLFELVANFKAIEQHQNQWHLTQTKRRDQKSEKQMGQIAINNFYNKFR